MNGRIIGTSAGAANSETLGHTSTREAGDHWREHAACTDTDPELFYPTDSNKATTALAQAVCATCPVTADCLADAIAHDERHGIWGGRDMARKRPVNGNAARNEGRRKDAADLVQRLADLAADGHTRDEACITLKVASNHVSRVLREAGRLDILDRLDGHTPGQDAA